MSIFEDNFASMMTNLSDFDGMREAPLDEDGSFQAALIPLREMVVFPSMVTPLFVERERSLLAIQAARTSRETVICVTQQDSGIDEPTPADMYSVGTEVVLGRLLKMPDDTTTVLVQGRRRVEILEYLETEPYFRVRARPVAEALEPSNEMEALERTVIDLFGDCIHLNENIPEDAYIYALNIDDPSRLSDFVAATLDLKLSERQEVLETTNVLKRLGKISVVLAKELDVLELENQIHGRIMEEVDKGQREMFLREQMRAIQTELGEGDIYQQELNEIDEKIRHSSMPTPVRDRALKEVSKLMSIPPMSPEIGIIRTYIDWLLDLPWEEATEDNLDISHVASILDADHYGLTKAKDRILEHIAVRKLAADKMKSPILCFAGPPGTGKTSLGKSIARALGREFVRVSLGGVRDEAEIRGHRRTYIGALPGRVVQAMKRAGTINPVFMLDEIDKLGNDFRGDPSSALLEVLDPEQNYSFSDHYLEVDYDLSKVFFITTANQVSSIPPALLDRLEIIDFPGYIDDEKLHIARQFLIPRALESHGLADRGIILENTALLEMIQAYTYEAGVRNLEREITTICRKLARRAAEGRNFNRRITPHSLLKLIGPPRIPKPLIGTQPEVGVAYGVAWTEAGGDVFPVEVSLMAGKGNMTLTGLLGEVMQESAQAALSYVRSRADEFCIDPETFESTDIHVHMPEGGIPKDGPSAGVTLVTALVSAFTERPVRHDVVMTGEITLHGKTIPVGGVKEKLLAAHRVKRFKVIMPEENRKDLSEIPKKALRDLQITFVTNLTQLLDIALLPGEDPADESADQPTEQLEIQEGA